jgi:hypothetical protein
MRITADQKIAGYPAPKIRRLMRETVGRSITLRYVRDWNRPQKAVHLQWLAGTPWR